MEHHVGDAAVSQGWSRVCNDLIKRVVDLYPATFTGVGQLPSRRALDSRSASRNSSGPYSNWASSGAI